MNLLIFIGFDEDIFNDDDDKFDHVNSILLASGQDDFINRYHFGDENFIPLSSGLHHSVMEHPTDDQHSVNSEFTENICKNNTSYLFRTILE